MWQLLNWNWRRNKILEISVSSSPIKTTVQAENTILKSTKRFILTQLCELTHQLMMPSTSLPAKYQTILYPSLPSSVVSSSYMSPVSWALSLSKYHTISWSLSSTVWCFISLIERKSAKWQPYCLLVLGILGCRCWLRPKRPYLQSKRNRDRGCSPLASFWH